MARRTPIQACWEECWSKHGEKLFSLKLRSKYADPSIDTHRSTSADPSQAPIYKRRSTLFAFVGVSVCGCVWFCGVCGWFFYFCGWFLILCLWECVHLRKKQMMRALVLQINKREKKKGANLEIIKIMYRRATVTVHICTVTVALVHLCTILYPPMWVFFLVKMCKMSCFLYFARLSMDWCGCFNKIRENLTA